MLVTNINNHKFQYLEKNEVILKLMEATHLKKVVTEAQKAGKVSGTNKEKLEEHFAVD